MTAYSRGTSKTWSRACVVPSRTGNGAPNQPVSLAVR